MFISSTKKAQRLSKTFVFKKFNFKKSLTKKGHRFSITLPPDPIQSFNGPSHSCMLLRIFKEISFLHLKADQAMDLLDTMEQHTQQKSICLTTRSFRIFRFGV